MTDLSWLFWTAFIIILVAMWALAIHAVVQDMRKHDRFWDWDT